MPRLAATSGSTQQPPAATEQLLARPRVVQSALSTTTEALAAELAHPTQTTPSWSPFEWQVAQAVCAMHGVAAVLSEKLRWQGPEQWTRFLREQRTHTTRRYGRIQELLTLIDDRARLEDLCLIALKGAELHSLRLYEPGERPMADVDLLVRAADGVRAGRMLESLGFQHSISTPRHRTFVRDAHHSPSNLGEHSDNYLKIELHERISEPLPLRVADITALIQPREPHPGLNPYPSKAALMTHLLLHAAGAMKLRAVRLIQLNDIARLSANMTAADWDRVLELGQAGREHWWALPPLQLTARYYGHVIPAHVLAKLSANCPWLLARICRRRTLSDVSLSHMRIDAFPGIEWSQSLTESVQYAANRLWPSKELLALRKQLALTEVAWSDSQWHHSSQGRRLLRWIVSRPPRAETMHTIRAALDRAP
jgi:Uncharacterised nucleotidyltransferase